MKLAEIVTAVFTLCLVVPLMIILALAGLVGIVFDILIVLLLSPFVYMLYLGRKREHKLAMERGKILQHSAALPSWEDSKATLVEVPNQLKRIDLNIQLKFCPHLVKLSSLMIKCPKCQYVFPRYVTVFSSAVTGYKYTSLKSGEIPITEMIRKEIQKNGCPSTFHCPKCNKTIIRSREPSGMCQLFGKRVYGEKLFCCTINQCI